MKNIVILIVVLFFVKKAEAAYNPAANAPTNFNGSGQISITKRWMGVITPNTGNGYSVDISSAGFSNVMSVNAIAAKNTATTTSVPNISVKSYTTTAVVLNIIEGNSSLVSILGSGVLLGVSTQFANVSGLTVWVIVEGN